MNTWKFLERMARERFEKDEAWILISVDCSKGSFYECKGGDRPPLKTRGQNKGKLNWDKFDRNLEIRFAITEKELRVWAARWEQETGKCANCDGEGQIVKSISVSGGTVYRDCPKCQATGLKQFQLAA